MKVYRLGTVNFQSRYVLSIDPGLITSGFCFWDKQSLPVLRTIETRENSTAVQFMDCYAMSRKQFEEYEKVFNSLKGFDYKDLEIIIEHSVYNPEFQFSIGLNVFLSFLVTKLLDKGVKKIVLVPPVVVQFFLQSRNLLASDIKRYVKHFLKEFQTLCTSPHDTDALFMCILVHYERFKDLFGVDLRVPELEYIDYTQINGG